MRGIRDVMRLASVYRLWQAPFARRKFAPVLAANDLQRVRRVLDVGCGPGTNTPLFGRAEYLGIDVSERYIEDARRRHGRSYVVADIAEYEIEGDRFDFILLNSLLHHIDDTSADRILEHLSTLLTEDGHVHILDLVLPDRRSLARGLARWDRGNHPRPLEIWRQMFTRHFDAVVFTPYRLSAGGVTLWNMVYFKGARRNDDE